MHYPVFPHLNYSFCLTEDSPSLQVLDQPIYQPILRFEDHSNVGKLYLTKNNKLYKWKNDQLTRYKDHLDFKQVTFGKLCRIYLLSNGKVWAEGRSKARHFMDTESEVADVRGVEIPFYEKKDRIVQIASFFQVTIAVTEAGKVFAVGEKLAKMIKLENPKFGFYELPLVPDPVVEEAKKPEQ